MIIDKIENWSLYFKESIFSEIKNELANYNSTTPDGVYKTHENFYFKVITYDTKLDSTIIESHQKEVDVQILFCGNENIKIYNDIDVVVIEAYDEVSDCQFYKNIGSPITEINLRPGYMAIFFPDDIHHPEFAVDGKIETLKKLILKIDEKLFA